MGRGEESDIFPQCTRTVTNGVMRKRSDPSGLQPSFGLLFPALPLTPNFLPSVSTIFVCSRHVNSAEVQLRGQETRNDPRLCFRRPFTRSHLQEVRGGNIRREIQYKLLLFFCHQFCFLFFFWGGIFRKKEDGNEAGYHNGPI